MQKRHYRALEVLADGKPHTAPADEEIRADWAHLFHLGLATRVEVQDNSSPWRAGTTYAYTITDKGGRVASVQQMELF